VTLLKQFSKLEWMHKGVMYVPLFHEGFKYSNSLNS